MLRGTWLVAACCGLWVGCGDPVAEQRVRPDAGPYRDFDDVDAARLPDTGAGPDAGRDAGSANGLDASFDPGFGIADGVRTNAPHLAFVNLGVDDLVITSIYFRMVDRGALDTLLISGEIENRGAVQQCIPLVDLAALDGLDILTIADSDAYISMVTGFINCIEPGGRGAFHGIETDLVADIVSTGERFEYAIDGLESAYLPHPDAPVLLSYETILTDTGSYGFFGELLSGPHPIYNTAILFYAKDEQGLIVDDTEAYPFDLDTIPANLVIEYGSYALGYHRGPVAGSLRFVSFLDGAAPPGSLSTESVVQPASPEAIRAKLARDRRQELRALRGGLR